MAAPQIHETDLFENPRASTARRSSRRRVTLEARTDAPSRILLVATGSGQCLAVAATVSDLDISDLDSLVPISEDNRTAIDSLQNVTATAVLDEIYQVAKQNSRLAVDYAIDHIDDLLLEGSFAECDAFLTHANPEELPDSLLVTFLGITLAAKPHLKKRRDFYDRALAELTRRSGREAAESVLRNYQ